MSYLVFPVEAAVLGGFGDVVRLNVRVAFDVGNRAGDFADFIVGAG